MCLLMHFCYFKIHFHQLGPFQLIKNNVEIFTCFVKFIYSMESLSKGKSQYMSYPVFNYPYDEFKDRICKEKVSEYKLVYREYSHCLNLSTKRALLKHLFL